MTLASKAVNAMYMDNYKYFFIMQRFLWPTMTNKLPLIRSIMISNPNTVTDVCTNALVHDSIFQAILLFQKMILAVHFILLVSLTQEVFAERKVGCLFRPSKPSELARTKVKYH
jgi:hypothetical protein